VLFQRVENELRALPGVTAVTDSRVPLLAGSNWGTGVKVQGFKDGPDIDNGARYNQVGAGYFSALGIRMLQGREFTEADGADGPKVAVVNERFVQKFGLGKDVIGKFMSINGNDTLNIQIVGLIKDAKYSSVKDSVPALFYLPWRQDRSVGSLSFYVRTALPPGQLLRTIPGVMKKIDPALPVQDIKTMPQQIRDNTFLDRMISILSAAFAVLATLLAGVGLYGVLAYTVAQRTREIGVRMALGANSGNVRLMVMRQVGGMLLFGGVAGILAAWGLGRAASSLLFGLKGYDPPVFLMATILLALVAFTAGYLPARRASEVDPIKALRYE
jgi:predicted permease